jgi:hypothetical protein
MEDKGSMAYGEVERNLAEWFLIRDNLSKEKGWGRKYRLRKIINSWGTPG